MRKNIEKPENQFPSMQGRAEEAIKVFFKSNPLDHAHGCLSDAFECAITETIVNNQLNNQSQNALS